jgi:catechol 2,3-dioxygenase-like lactoylglutathione lyase family enzyme
MTVARIESISPFFVVSDMQATIAFYREKLGFEVTFQEPQTDPFFAIVSRDGAMIFLKYDESARAIPNPSQHASMKWDAYLYVPDPDALAAELSNRGLKFHVPLMDTSEGLRGFEVRDPDGYVLFFGRPR